MEASAPCISPRDCVLLCSAVGPSIDCWDKRAAYKARIKCYGSGYKGVYVNEDLTEEQTDLFLFALAAKKQKLVKSAWTMNGASYISKTVRGEQEMIEVTSKEHIKALVPKLNVTF